MDIATLASAAVAALVAYFAAGATEAAKTAGKDLYGWVKGKLTVSGAEALAKLEAEPGKARNVDRLKADLEEFLEANPALAKELQALLPKEAAATHQKLVQTGDHNTGVQAVGSKVNIQR